MSKIVFIAGLIIILNFISAPLPAQIHLSGSLSGVLSAGEYIVDDHIQVDSAETLVIQAGAHLRFNGHYKFNIYGLLQAIGEEQDSILFTRLNPVPESRWWSIRFFDSSSDSSRLQYCTIEWSIAYLGSGSEQNGGGIYIEYASPTISHCTLRNNVSYSEGGGIYAKNGAPVIEDCKIAYNEVGGFYERLGGGIYLLEGTVHISGCEISSNYAFEDGSAVYISWCQGECFSDCILDSNEVQDEDTDFAVSMFNSSILMDNCRFNNNISGGIKTFCGENCQFYNVEVCGSSGTGIGVTGGNQVDLYQCKSIGNLRAINALSCPELNLERCLFTDSDEFGLVFGSCGGNIRNCTVSHNDGIGIYLSSSCFNILNTIVCNNQEWGITCGYSINTSIQYSDVYGNLSGNIFFPPLGVGELVAVNVNGDSCDVFHNIFLDPLFVSPGGNNYNLTANSPCIDAGYPYPPVDPDGTISDMGRYYFDQSGSGVLIQGHCYLENQSSHFGSKVISRGISAGTETDSTYTDSSGYYHFYLEAGVYDLFFSHFGYISDSLMGQNVISPVVFPEITLVGQVPVWNIAGDLNGVLASGIYQVVDDIEVAAADSLIIEAGSIFLFGEGTGFDIYGKLSACGNEADSIKFIADQGVIEWTGMDFVSSQEDTNQLEYCLIRGSGGIGILVDHCALEISNSAIESNWSDSSGGGIYCRNGAVARIENCLISGNISAEGGGGIICDYGSNVCIIDCEITENQSGEIGGGIFCQSASPVIEGCEISYNLSGGGIGCQDYASPTITGCQIDENAGSGILCNNNSIPTISECEIAGNYTNGYGGGVQLYSFSNALIVDCEIADNTGGLWGGGVFAQESSPYFINCIFSGNYAECGGGFKSYWGCSAIFENCQFWGNDADWSGGLQDQAGNPMLLKCLFGENSGGNIRLYQSMVTIDHCTLANSDGDNMNLDASTLNMSNTIVAFGDSFGINMVTECTVSIQYSDFFGNACGAFGGIVPHPLGILTGVNLNGDSCDVFHNIFLDPLFVDSNDYHLTPGSPCIDAGNPAYQLDPDSTITDMGFFYFDQSAFVSQISSSQIPRGFSLSAPRPNPFNSSTILMFTLTEQIKVSLIIYNLLGQEVLKVADGVKEAGVYRFRIDGDALPSGIYFAFLKAENQQRGQKLLLLK